MKTRIHYTKPSITEREIQYANDAATIGWGDRCYEYIHRFEDAFKEYLGVKYAIATSSCTGALHMGLVGVGVGSEDEVIMADTNWIATAAPVVHVGAKPVFVDILPDTWCLDPVQVESAITSRTKAIIAVHLYGNLCEMDRLLAIGERYGIPVIEDAAEAIGSEYRGVRAGSIGKFGTFSFHGSKTVTTGEGGMFVTNDPELYEDVLTLSNHGRARGQKKQFWPEMVGFKYKMSNIQAALGCAQMERIEELVSKKQEIMSHYRGFSDNHQAIKCNPVQENTVNGAWMPNYVFDHETGINQDALVGAFAAQNIDARVFFAPLSSTPSFQSVPGNTNAWCIPNRSINLPSYHDLSSDDLNRILQVISDIVDERL